MKKTMRFFTAAICSAMAAVACSKNIAEPSSNGTFTLNFSAEIVEPLTKATLTPDEGETAFAAAWETSDKMDVYIDGTDYIAEWNGASFSISDLPEDLLGQSVTLKAFYPSVTEENDLTNSNTRTQSGAAYNSYYDTMTSGEVTVDINAEGTLIIPMVRNTSVLYFHVSSSETEPLSKAELTVGDRTIVTTLTDVNANDATIWFNVAPGTYGLSLKLTSESGKTAVITRKSDITTTEGKLYKVIKEVTFEGNDEPQGNAPFAQLRSTSDLVPDMEFVFVATSGSAQKIAAHIEKDYMTAADVTIASDNTITLEDESTVEVFVLGGTTDNWTFTNQSGKMLGTTEAKKVSFTGTGGVTTWTISISEGQATVKSTDSAKGTLLYNAFYPRFTTYKSGQTAVQIYARSSSPFVVAPATCDVPYVSKSGDVDFTTYNAEGKNVTVSSSENWLACTIVDGKLHYEAAKNLGAEARTAIAELSVEDGNTANVTFTQAACGDKIEVTGYEDLAADAEQTDFTVEAILDEQATNAWTASVTEDWITVANVDGKLHITTTANTDARRSADVTLTLTGNSAVTKTLTVSQLGSCVTKTFSFGEHEDFANWSGTYSEHTLEYDECSVVFERADKNTSTITDVPVTKGNYVEVKMKGGRIIQSITFTCKQWGSYAQTITMHYSTDNGGNYIESKETSSTFKLVTDATSQYGSVDAIKYTFSSSSKQVGIVSAEITYVE